MSKNILSLFGFLSLLLVAFGGGYYFRSRSRVTDKVSNQIVIVTPIPTDKTATIPSPTITKAPQTELVFSNYNGAGVANLPTSPTTFTITTKRSMATIQDYHWNSARGKTPGTIGLKHEDGTLYGPWEAKGDPGQGGVPDAYWTVYPSVEIPAGTYTVIDSDPASWAQNSGTRGIGMSQIYAVKE